MNLSSSRVKLGSSVMDSGLVVVVFIITSLIITVFSFLLFVDYEWCHVLFKNNTVSSIDSKFCVARATQEPRGSGYPVKFL